MNHDALFSRDSPLCVLLSAHKCPYFFFLFTSPRKNLLFNSLLFKHFRGRFGNLRREFLDSLIIQDRPSTIDREGVTLQPPPPPKERSFKWRKKIATNEARERERKSKTASIYSYFSRTPFVSCVCKTKEEARRASLRATGFPRTSVCVHKTPRGGGGGRERDPSSGCLILFRSRGDAILYINFFSYFDSLINLLGTEFRKEEANIPTCRVR